jgi:nucleotide-binding universal stress UspA family protein
MLIDLYQSAALNKNTYLHQTQTGSIPLKDLLVTLNHSAQRENRLQPALELTDIFDAHLTGVYAERQMDYAYYGDVMGTIAIDAIQQQREQDMQEVEQQFKQAVVLREGKCTFVADRITGNHRLFAQAAVSDLIVCEQSDPKNPANANAALTEDLIMRTGKPVLVIPYIGCQATLGQSILVAWDHSREASRAVHDAIPLLQKAESVNIVSVVKKDQKQHEIATADLAEHLARHNINVVAQDMVKNEVPVAETLLSRISDTGADMLVMGAYGHSRLREYTFGGVTRTLLNSMTVPVLMTH